MIEVWDEEGESNMKAYEVAVKVTREGELLLPEPLRDALPRDQVVRMIILVPEPMESEDDAGWARVTTEQFLAGYSGGDAVYDRI